MEYDVNNVDKWSGAVWVDHTAKVSFRFNQQDVTVHSYDEVPKQYIREVIGARLCKVVGDISEVEKEGAYTYSLEITKQV
jgi:hypothetical protein